MTADSAARPTRARPPRAHRKATAPAPKRAPATAPRLLADGDTAPRLTPKALERDRVSRATTRAQTATAMALADVLKQHAQKSKLPPGPPGEWLREVKALIDGASPDEAKALRRILFQPAAPVAPGTDPDLELAPGWRDGGYPYRHLVRSGVHLFKFWFSVSRDEQRRRFKERRAHPLKQWKLSPIDMASLDKWSDYTRAKEAMLLHTDTSDAPWTVVKSDCKKRARLNAMRYLLHRLPFANKDAVALGAVDPLLVGRAALVAGVADEFTAVSSA